MAYGLEITNPGGELVISSEGYGVYLLGRMSQIGGVNQPTGIATNPDPGRQSGYTVLQINSAVKPIIAFDLPLNKRCGVYGLTNLGGNLWECRAHCGDTPDADGFDTIEYALPVWAYAMHNGLASQFGLAIYNAAGAVAYDLTVGVPLAAVAYVPGTAASSTIPALTRPGVLGFTNTDEVVQGFGGGNTWNVRRFRGAWQRTSATVVGKVTYTAQKYRYFSPITDPLPVEEGDTYDQPGFFMEVNGFP